MAEFPALPLWTDAYIADTTHLTMLESGCYLQILMVSWRRADCAVDDDDLKLARICRMRIDKWQRVRPVLEPFFVIKDGLWVQKRLQKEAAYLAVIKTKRVEAARARWLKEKEIADAPAMHMESTHTHTHTQKKDSGNPSDSLSSRDDIDIKVAIDSYNAMAQKAGLPLCSKLTDKRRIALRHRLRELGGNEKWYAAMQMVPDRSFLLGKNDRGWTASIDFFLQPNSVPRLLEGMYDNGKRATNYDSNTVRYMHEHTTIRKSKTDEVKEMLERVYERHNCGEKTGMYSQSTDGMPLQLSGLQTPNRRH